MYFLPSCRVVMYCRNHGVLQFLMVTIADIVATLYNGSSSFPEFQELCHALKNRVLEYDVSPTIPVEEMVIDLNDSVAVCDAMVSCMAVSSWAEVVEMLKCDTAKCDTASTEAPALILVASDVPPTLLGNAVGTAVNVHIPVDRPTLLQHLAGVRAPFACAADLL